MPQRRHEPLKLIVVGGGYAGLSALIALRRKAPSASITLIDPRPYHLLITRLHESVRRPLQELQIPFSKLAERFGFSHLQQTLRFDEVQLAAWNEQKAVQLDERRLAFDYLLIAVGTQPDATYATDGVHDLNTISRKCLASDIDRLLAEPGRSPITVNVVGAGPSGIQFCVELANRLSASRTAHHINLIDGADTLLTPFPAAVGNYVKKRLAEKRIDLWLNRFYRGQDGGRLKLEHARSGEPSTLASDLTLLLPGKKPKLLLHANASGQVLLDGRPLSHVFTAGDCSYFDRMGSNLLTSQAAIRKGKAAANNILLKAGLLRFCLPYMHQELGYLLSLGDGDAAGWLVSKSNIITGMPAYLAKQASEVQYDLLLSGIDSYFL